MIKKIALFGLMLIASIFTLTACGDDVNIPNDQKQAALDAAISKIILIQDKTELGSDFNIPATATAGSKYKNKVYTIEWSTDKADNVAFAAVEGSTVDKTCKITQSKADNVVAKVTAKVTDGKYSASVDFSFTIIKDQFVTWAELQKLTKGTIASIEGVLVAIEPFSSFGTVAIALQDKETGNGYYVYRLNKMTEDDYKKDLVVGNTLKISGKVDVYGGAPQIVEASYKVVSTDKTEIKSVDYTTKFSEMVKTKIHSVASLTGKITEIGTMDGDGRYTIKFKVGDSASGMYVNKYLTPKTSEAYKAFEALALKVGYKVQFTGIVSYNGDDAQLLPINKDSIKVLDMTVTDDDRVAATVSEVKNVLKDSYIENKEIILPTTGSSFNTVAIAWTLVEGAGVATLIDGKLVLTVLPAGEKTVKISAVVTIGAKTETVQIEFTVGLAPELTSGLLKGKKAGDSFTGKYVVAYIDEPYNFMIIQNTKGSAEVNLPTDNTAIRALVIGDEINITAGKIVAYAKGMMGGGAGLLVDEVTFTKTASAVAIPTLEKIIKIDWATDSNDFANVTIDMFGGYVELINVTFTTDNNITDGNYAYFTQPTGNFFKAGLFKTNCQVSKDKKYTIKGYLAGANRLTKDGILRFSGVTITEQVA